jgi:hypothetical protein
MTNVSARERYYFEIKAIRLSLIIALLFLLSTALASAQSCVNVTDNLYINEDTTLCQGDYTIVDNNPTGIIIINANNVTLDCNGANITRGASGAAVTMGIRATSKSNITIKNCKIGKGTANFGSAIYLTNTNNSSIINNTVSECGSSGCITLKCTSGDCLSSSSNNTFINNIATGSPGGMEEDCGTCRNTTLIGNNFSYNSQNGIFWNEGGGAHI